MFLFNFTTQLKSKPGLLLYLSECLLSKGLHDSTIILKKCFVLKKTTHNELKKKDQTAWEAFPAPVNTPQNP